MSFDSLLAHSVTVFTDGIDPVADRYGNEVPDTDLTGVTTPGRIEQNSADEDIIDRDTRVTTFTLFLPKEIIISALSRVSWDGRDFRVTGEPEVVYGAADPHHIEAVLTEVLG